MKILLINSYHYHKGGADAVYFNTAELLKHYGHEVYFFSAIYPDKLTDEAGRYFANGIDFRNLSLAGKISAIPSFLYNRDVYTKLLSLLEEINPDVAHIHLFMGGLSSSVLLALRKRKIPIVHTAHDFRLICPAYLFLNGKNEVCEKCIDKFYLRCLLNRCSENNFSQSAMLSLDAYFRKYFVKPLNLIDRFIFVSNFSMNKHIEFDLNYKAKAEMLYNFNLKLSSIVPSNTKGKYFLYYGRISREKGVHTLIESAIKVGIILKVVGTGPLIETFTQHHFNNIELLGYKTGEELWSLVRNASFIIVPSECYENNPLTIIEAYSFGKPVIGARTGGIPEIIEEGKTGYLFDARDKFQLEKLLRKSLSISDGEYQGMSANARTFAEMYFNPDDHYKKLIRVYRDVIKNNEI